ncbi:MAG: UDP-glucose/GDP-mannose dehydrogenase family protein [Candidatus Woesearchaeota archaeon]
MKISVFGAGYVGLTTAACLAEKGNHVTAYDIDKDKIALLKLGGVPIEEDGLGGILSNVTNSEGDTPFLRFSSDVVRAVRDSDLLIAAVGTPFENRFMNTEQIWSVARSIQEAVGEDRKILAIKSTVPVGTTREVQEFFDDHGQNVVVVSNPEFLVEGKAVADTKRPDRVIVGTDHREIVQNVCDELYAPFLRRGGGGVLYMNPSSSELSKLAANAYLAMRISFINEIANFAEAIGADIDEVRLGMGSDRRIGMHYLFPGQGYGGSCFPKDLPTLIEQIKRGGLKSWVLEGAYQRNAAQKRVLSEKVISRFGRDYDENLDSLTLGMWGLAFKADTDDVRESPAIEAIKLLTGRGARVVAYDPIAGDNASRELTAQMGMGKVVIVDQQYFALNGCDALVVCTEWDAFRSPDFDRIHKELKNPIVFDGRNLYNPNQMEKRGFEYYSIGRRQITQRS